MAQLTPPQRLALGRYWSEILGGAAQRLNTAPLFDKIRDRAAQLGLPSVGVPANVISTLRGYAGRMLESARQLNRAADTESLMSNHIAEAPWARPLAEQNTMPIWHVSFEHTIERLDGSVVVKHHTIDIRGVPPGTVGELRDLVSAEAVLLAQEGGAQDSGTPKGRSLGTANLMMLAV